MEMELPSYLQELLEGCPSGNLKLTASWENFSTETQIKILCLFKENRRLKIPHLLLIKALEHESDYVRYLTAKIILDNKFFRYEDDQKLFVVEKIAADKSPLVKYLSGHNWLSGNKEDKFELFFSIPYEGQLAYIGLHCSFESFVRIIYLAISNKIMNETALANLIEEYFKKNSFSWFYCRELESLWKLVSTLGDSKIAWAFLKYLPTETSIDSDYDYNESVSSNVINFLDKNKLVFILRRKDVQLFDFRREIFFSFPEKYDEVLLEAAASANLTISAEEFHGLIKGEKKAHLRVLKKSNCHPETAYLPLSFILALEDIGIKKIICLKNDEENSSELEEEEEDDDEQYGFYCKPSKFIEGYSDAEKERAILHVAIYKIAECLVPWDEGESLENLEWLNNKSDSQFDFLKDRVVHGDTWKTYMNFLGIDWSMRPKAKKQLFQFVRHYFCSIYLIPPQDPDDLFGEEGKNPEFVQHKIDYLHKEISKVNKAIDLVAGGAKEIFNVIKIFAIIFIIIWVVKKLFF